MSLKYEHKVTVKKFPFMKVQNNAKRSSIFDGDFAGGEVTRYLLKKCKEENTQRCCSEVSKVSKNLNCQFFLVRSLQNSHERVNSYEKRLLHSYLMLPFILPARYIFWSDVEWVTDQRLYLQWFTVPSTIKKKYFVQSWFVAGGPFMPAFRWDF